MTALALLVLLGMAQGCAAGGRGRGEPRAPETARPAGSPRGSAPSTATASARPDPRYLTVYFVDASRIELVPVRVPVAAGRDRAEQAVATLFAAPASAGVVSPVPDGVSVPRVRVAGRTVWVDFGRDLADAYPRGRTARDLFAAAVALTLIDSLGVERVAFTVEGSAVTTPPALAKLTGARIDRAAASALASR